MKYRIFLDIDGVMLSEEVRRRILADNPSADGKDLNQKFVNNFEQEAFYYLHLFITFLEKLSGERPEVIISSDWRRSSTVASLRNLLKQYKFSEYIVDKIADPQPGMEREPDYHRGKLIQEYLQTWPGGDFIIFDDNPFDIAGLFPNQFVHCTRGALGAQEIRDVISRLELDQKAFRDRNWPAMETLTSINPDLFTQYLKQALGVGWKECVKQQLTLKPNAVRELELKTDDSLLFLAAQNSKNETEVFTDLHKRGASVARAWQKAYTDRAPEVAGRLLAHLNMKELCQVICASKQTDTNWDFLTQALVDPEFSQAQRLKHIEMLLFEALIAKQLPLVNKLLEVSVALTSNNDSAKKRRCVADRLRHMINGINDPLEITRAVMQFADNEKSEPLLTTIHPRKRKVHLSDYKWQGQPVSRAWYDVVAHAQDRIITLVRNNNQWNDNEELRTFMSCTSARWLNLFARESALVRYNRLSASSASINTPQHRAH